MPVQEKLEGLKLLTLVNRAGWSSILVPPEVMMPCPRGAGISQVYIGLLLVRK